MSRQFNGKRIVFQQIVLRQLDVHMRKNEVGPLFHKLRNMKINTKWIKDLTAKAKAIKLLEENPGISLQHLGLGSGFLDITKSTSDKRKTDFRKN